MSIYTGYFLIADISGYTAYLTQSEMDHASPILRSLLEALVMQVGEPLHLWKMEGDAVLAYSTSRGFPSGETFLTICENLYQAFAARRLDIIQHTTCLCKACANVSGLDLKIIAHHGQFEEIKIGPMTDISGADVILVHRMAKTDVKEVTGIRSYALFSEAAYLAMGIETELLQYQTRFEHFGDVPMRVYDLARAWEKHRAGQAMVRVEDDEAVYAFSHFLAASPALAWELLTAPQHKQKWMEMLRDGQTLGLEHSAVVKKKGAGQPVIHRCQRLPTYPASPQHIVLGRLADEVFGRCPQEAVNLTGAGIDELFVECVGDAMAPDSSAPMFYIPYDSMADAERLVDILALLQGAVHRTTLPRQVEQALLS